MAAIAAAATAATTTTTTTSQQEPTTNGKHTNEPDRTSAELAGSGIDNSNRADISSGNADVIVVYDVEHLATFSTSNASSNGSHELVTANNGSKQLAGSSNCDGSSDDDHDDLVDGADFSLVSSRATRCKSGQVQHKFDGCGIKTPQVALRRLFELEKLSGIWTQRMQIELRHELMLIVDCETKSVVEKFDKNSVTKPEAFNEYNHIYNNIVVFIIRQQSGSGNDQDDSEGELHVFQCISQQAQQLVEDILDWKLSRLQVRRTSSSSADQQQTQLSAAEGMAKLISDSPSGNSSRCAPLKEWSSSSANANANANANNKLQVQSEVGSKSAQAGSNQTKPMVTLASSSGANKDVPVVNVNVRETVQVFNQIAALREKSKPGSPTGTASGAGQQHPRPSSEASASASASSSSSSSSSNANSNSNSNSSSSGSASGQQQTGKEELPLAKIGAAGASFFKQRSIRARLGGQDPHLQQAKPPVASNSTDSTAASCTSSSCEQTKSHHQAADNPSASRHSKMLPNSSSSNSSNASSSNRSSGAFQHHSSKHNISTNGNNSNHHHNNHNNHHHQHHKHQSASNQRESQDSGHAQVSTPGSSQQKSKPPVKRPSGGQRSSHLEQVTTNESYVLVLNHCFDDIEKFILRLQQAMAASRELYQAKRNLSKRSSGSGSEAAAVAVAIAPVQLTAAEMALLSARARAPNEEDYFEILSKFKLAFNLLAKLKGCIHEPNAPELVHFLFTPLAIIIESARNAKPTIDPTLVGVPYLNQEALDLLSNCCTSKEYDMWMSLGPNWTQTIDTSLLKASRLPSSFQPIFSDGWAPIIGELELIGLGVAGSRSPLHPSDPDDQSQPDRPHRHRHRQERSARPRPPSALGFPAPPNDILASAGGPKSSKGHAQNGHVPVSRHLSEPAVAAAHEPLPVGVYGNYAEPALDTRLDGTTTSPYRSAQDVYHRPGNTAGQSAHLGRATGSSNRSGSAERFPNQLRMVRGANSRPLGPTKSANSRAKDSHYHNHNHHHHPSYNRPFGAHDHLIDHHSPDQISPATHRLHYPMMASDRGGAAATKEQAHLTKPYSSRKESTKQRDLYEGSAAHYLGPNEDSGDYFAREANEDELQLHLQHTYRHHQHETMLLDLGPALLDWFYELQSRGAMIVRVLFSRAANNDKELSVRRGEILEILDDSRKWWRARNIDMQVAYVPHTIVAPMQGYQTLDDLLANNPADLSSSGEDPSFLMSSSSVASLQYARHPLDHHHARTTTDDWHSGGGRNSKNATGAFREVPSAGQASS